MGGFTQDFFNNFLLTFVPLFIALDAVGNLPIIFSMTLEMKKQARQNLVNVAILTAGLVGMVFLFFGRLILSWMGISVGAFAIAGGIVLLVLSIRYMTSGHLVEVIEGEMIAVVPIGTPLTVGPATIATLLLLATQFPIIYVVISFALNMLIVWLIFMASNYIMRFLGRGGIRAVSKISSLLLAAIAVNMIIRGLSLIGVLNVPIS